MVAAKKTSKKKVIVTSGKRKRAIARAYIKEGSGNVLVNGRPISLYFPNYAYLRALEPLVIAGDNLVSKVDVEVNVIGGGVTGQIDAVRQAIARGLVEYFDDEDLEKRYLAYDMSLIVFDPRRTEPHKPSRSKQGPRRKKQLSKR
ncbi:MAG: 30S ribosomal protein S9 [Candidatus Nanohaloarchaeota archaeon]|nr:30S ribosomal protein S9 [Candidatus Nanohaloarchaeota archaeon]